MTHNTRKAAFGLGPIMPSNNWPTIGPNRTNAKAEDFGPIPNRTNATQLDQRKPLILLAILYVWSNLSKYIMVVIENIFFKKNIIKNFRTRARVRVRARSPITRTRARNSIKANFATSSTPAASEV